MSALNVFDFTLKREGITRPAIEKYLKLHCKKWAFQIEKGRDGYIHYQGRCSTRVKIRESQQIEIQPWANHCHWSKTSEANKNNFNYVMKDNGFAPLEIMMMNEDLGPWTEKDIIEEIYIPRQIREIVDLRPWQKSIVDSCDVWDTRSINVLYDPNGNIGKSVLVGYMRCHGKARKLPPLNDYKDVMRIICDMPTSRCYLFDMPRAMKKDKLGQLYTAIEEIKSGYAFDDRYSFKEKFFDCPNIWVFANMLPDFNLLSRDRWFVWEIIDNKLQEFKEGEE